MSRTVQFCGLLLLLLAACCGGAPAQKPPPGDAEIDWPRKDALARRFAQRFFRDLRDTGSVDGLLETYFSPATTAEYLKVLRGQTTGRRFGGCFVAETVADNVPEAMLRRKLVADFNVDYLEALYLFASRPWHKETVAGDFDLHETLTKKMAEAEGSMDFFRFAPAPRHCAVEQLETPGQLEQSLDEAERAAGLLRSALPPGLWDKPEFREQMEAAEKERPETLDHSRGEDGLHFQVPLNALLSVSVLEQDGRMVITDVSISPAEQFVRRKPAPPLERAGALADRFIARLHDELDLAKPMDEFMVRNYLSRLRAYGHIPFFVGDTMNGEFQPQMTDEELRQAMIASGDFLYLLLLHASQTVKPGDNANDLQDFSQLVPPQVFAAGRKNSTVSFLFHKEGEPEGDIPNVRNREELRHFLDDLDDINASMRRELPDSAFTSPGYQFVTGNLRREKTDEVNNRDLGPEFSGPVQVFVVHREFFEFEIIEEFGELRIWKVDLK